jgi:hypothetical protein
MQKMNACFIVKEEIYIANMVVLGDLSGERNFFLVQFVVVFWLLKQGWPLTNFEAMKLLF